MKETVISSLRVRRVALASLFLIFGTGMSSWVTRTPDLWVVQRG